jgi:alkylmercury lyase
MIIAGRPLFAWCALDTLFIPGLLDKVAEITSICPVSGTPVRLTVSPEGVQSVDPPGTALSVVFPATGTAGATTGPASPT